MFGQRLAEGALLVGAVVEPELIVDDELERLAALAATCAATDAAGLAEELFAGGRFRGNQLDYYDPKNSVLPAVLDRGLGIPISLSVLFVVTGSHRGIDVKPIGMPGHFLAAGDGHFFDVFDGGAKLDAEGCRRLYSRLAGRDVALPPRALDATTGSDTLQRMLWNLRSIAEGRNDAAMGYRVLSLLSAVSGVPLQVTMSWATALSQRGRFDQAAAVAAEAAESAPASAKDRLTAMSERWAARLN